MSIHRFEKYIEEYEYGDALSIYYQHKGLRRKHLGSTYVMLKLLRQIAPLRNKKLWSNHRK